MDCTHKLRTEITLLSAAFVWYLSQRQEKKTNTMLNYRVNTLEFSEGLYELC